jgi:hypothetical protein
MFAALALGVVFANACGGRSMAGADLGDGVGGDGASGGSGGTRVAGPGGSSGVGAGGTRVGSAGAYASGGTTLGGGNGGGGIGGTGVGGAAVAGAAGAAMVGVAGAAGASLGGAAGSGDGPFPPVALTGCSISTPLEGGFSQCSNGLLHRPLAGSACLNALPRERSFEPELLFELEQAARSAGYTEAEISLLYQCRADTDCRELPNGYCDLASPEGWSGAGSFTQCRYACSTDADCGGGTLCECGDPGGQCVTAQCFYDSECGEGLRCAPYDATPGCAFESRIWECQRLDDECSVDTHCGYGQACIFIEGHRRCTSRICQ